MVERGLLRGGSGADSRESPRRLKLWLGHGTPSRLAAAFTDAQYALPPHWRAATCPVARRPPMLQSRPPGRDSYRRGVEDGRRSQGRVESAAAEFAALRSQVEQLRSENARLLRLLELTPQQAAAPGPAQAGWFEAPPGPVAADSPAASKVALFAALFGARTDLYALRWENTRSGKAGWLPAVRGGWRKGVRHEDRDYSRWIPRL